MVKNSRPPRALARQPPTQESATRPEKTLLHLRQDRRWTPRTTRNTWKFAAPAATFNYFHSSRPHLTICRACCADRWNRTQPLRHIPSAAGFFLRHPIRHLIRTLQSPCPPGPNSFPVLWDCHTWFPAVSLCPSCLRIADLPPTIFECGGHFLYP